MNCIINVSVGGWYPKGMQRLRNSLEAVGYNQAGFWASVLPHGCPPHSEVPYAFKPYSFKWAKENGYKNVLWCDSAVWAQQRPDYIFRLIEEKGYMILRNGWVTGNWSSDEQLKAFGYTREDSWNIPHAMACVIGINFASKEGNHIFEEYFKHQHLFKGSWKNENNHLGTDPRIMGTRHDQTILSLIAHKHGYEFTNPQGIIDYNINNKNSILLTQGM